MCSGMIPYVGTVKIYTSIKTVSNRSTSRKADVYQIICLNNIKITLIGMGRMQLDKSEGPNQYFK